MITKNCIEALIDLVKRHSKSALTESLMEHVKKIAPTATVSVYELYSVDNAQGFNAANVESAMVHHARDSDWSGRPIQEYEGFTACVVSKSVVNLNCKVNGALRMLVPVYGRSGIAGILAIDCAGNEPEMLYMVQAMSDVWNNQQLLLDRNERDVLTGLMNRHGFESKFRTIFGNSTGAPTALEKNASKSLALVDIDHFKEVNDTHGHLHGDEILVQLTQIMTRSFRHYDYLFRYGGEEFIVILNHVDMNETYGILNRFRQVVEDHTFSLVGKKTVSIGVTGIIPSELPTTILDRADKALYYAKQHGRNRVAVYEQLVATGELQAKKVEFGDVELF